MLSWIVAVLMLLQPLQPESSRVLTLQGCHWLVEENYPAADKIELDRKLAEINQKIAAAERYPQVSASGRASYQSDVTEVDFTPPGAEPPTFSRDRYNLSLHIEQLLYDGGTSRVRESVEEAEGHRSRQSTRMELHQVKERVNRVYFETLRLRNRISASALLMEDLRRQLETVRARVEQGVVLPSEQTILETELIRARQDSIRLRARWRGAREVLGILTGAEIDGSVRLRLPEVDWERGRNEARNRPAYAFYEASRNLLEQRISLAGTRWTPRISAFATTSYGRPGLDLFEDDLQGYYLFGLSVRWDLWNGVNAGREQQALRTEMQKIGAEERSFEQRMESDLSRLRNTIEALEQVIEEDEQLIQKSRQIAEEHSRRLNRGVITATEYLSSLNRLNQAILEREQHRIERAEAEAGYLTKQGVPLR